MKLSTRLPTGSSSKITSLSTSLLLYKMHHHDAVPGTGTRFSSFRRVGATAVGAQAPQHVDIIPFIAAVRKMWPGEEVRPGPWLGHMSIATELYDYVVGEVTFAAPPTITPQPKLQIK